MLVCATDGTLAADIRPLTRINCSVVLQEGTQRERGSAGGGGRHDYSVFLADNAQGEMHALSYAKEAVRQAQVQLIAKEAPAVKCQWYLAQGGQVYYYMKLSATD